MTDKTYNSEQPWLPFSEALFDWDESFHRLMLGDRIRMQSYESAIKETVNPGDVVIDLGTGTGILSQWALEAGADKVYGIELNREILALATDRMAKLGFSSNFVPVNQISYDVVLPKKADVLISEIMGNMLDNEDFQPILADAINRLLKSDGKKIPQHAHSCIVPVASLAAHRAVGCKDIATINNSYSLSRMLADKRIDDPYNLYYDTIVPHACYLANPQPVREYKSDWKQSPVYSKTLQFVLTSHGELTGFKAYFVAQLSENYCLDISGDDIANRKTSDSWKHAYLPIKKTISVEPGDVLDLTFTRFYQEDHNMEAATLHQGYAWQGKILRRNELIDEFSQTMAGTQVALTPA